MSHPCATGCGAAIEDAPRTFPRTPETRYCSPECRHSAQRDQARRSYRKHRIRRIGDTLAWQDSHYERSRANTRRNQLENPEREAHASRVTRLSRLGVTVDTYEAMREGQGGVCAICGCPETRRTPKGPIARLAVDHDHLTEVVRGLLCSNCNTALGYLERFERDPGWLGAARAYIRRSRRDSEVAS